MKYIVAVVLAAALCTVMANSCHRPCVTDADCRRDECCALSFTGQAMECREMGERVGEACGAPYLCSECYRNLSCTEFHAPEMSSHIYLSAAYDGLTVGASIKYTDPQLERFLEEANEASQRSDCPPPATSTCQNISATLSEMVTVSETVQPKPMIEEKPSREDL